MPTKHSKTPISVHFGQDYIEFFDKKDNSLFGEIECSPEFVEANAQHIVKCVNNYEDLARALKRIQTFVCVESGNVIDEDLHKEYLIEIESAQQVLKNAGEL